MEFKKFNVYLWNKYFFERLKLKSVKDYLKNNIELFAALIDNKVLDVRESKFSLCVDDPFERETASELFQIFEREIYLDKDKPRRIIFDIETPGYGDNCDAHYLTEITLTYKCKLVNFKSYYRAFPSKMFIIDQYGNVESCDPVDYKHLIKFARDISYSLINREAGVTYGKEVFYTSYKIKDDKDSLNLLQHNTLALIAPMVELVSRDKFQPGNIIVITYPDPTTETIFQQTKDYKIIIQINSNNIEVTTYTEDNFDNAIDLDII